VPPGPRHLCSLRAVRTLVTAALVLGLAAPAQAAPFGKPRTIGSAPSDYHYGAFSGYGPHGGATFFLAGAKGTGAKRTQRLYTSRVEAGGHVRRLTRTPILGHTPFQNENGSPDPYVAVGPHWRMLMTERLDSGRHPGWYSVRIAPNGRRVARQWLPRAVTGVLRTNARGDAIASFGNGFTIARAAGRFVRAPEALVRGEDLPVLALDGSLYDLRRPDFGKFSVAHSSGRRWAKAQTIFPTAVPYYGLVTSAVGQPLLAYGVGVTSGNANVVVRWGSRAGHFGQPVKLASQADPFTIGVEAIPGGAYAVEWTDVYDGIRGPRDVHLMRASRAGGAFRETARWTASDSTLFRQLLPLADGRTVVGWSTYDQVGNGPGRLMVAVIDSHGKIGPTQTMAVGQAFDGLIGLRRLGRNRAALVWTDTRKGKLLIRMALTRK
jgi:hypothetical protein